MTIRIDLQNAYLEWVNDYLTIEKYAEHKQITTECASHLIEAGRQAHESIVNELKLTEEQ